MLYKGSTTLLWSLHVAPFITAPTRDQIRWKGICKIAMHVGVFTISMDLLNVSASVQREEHSWEAGGKRLEVPLSG